ncbi:MAG: lysophospholipid acyltransferase family protein [Phycisphaerales bacterium]
MTGSPARLGPLSRRNPGRPRAAILFYELCWSFLWIAFTLIYRLRITGRHNIPRSGPLLVVANHQSHLDPPCIGMAFSHRHLNFIARVGLFSSRLFGLAISTLNAVPIKENGSDTAAIRTALHQLALGRALLIFPEGTRSPDGTIHDFKRGFWLLMSRAKCPVLPVAIDGAFDAYPRGTSLPRLWGQRLAVNIGQIIPYQRLHAMGPEAGLPYLRQVIDDLRADAEHERRAALGDTAAATPAIGLDTARRGMHRSGMSDVRSLSLLISAVLIASTGGAAGIGGCAAPVASGRTPGVAPPSLLDDQQARDAARAWLAGAGITLDDASTDWGTLVATSRGHALAAHERAGRTDTGAAIMRSFYFHFEGESIVAAWGPRALGSGCTCHYPAVSRIPSP